MRTLYLRTLNRLNVFRTSNRIRNFCVYSHLFANKCVLTCNYSFLSVTIRFCTYLFVFVHNYSRHLNTEPSGIRTAIPRTLFVSGFRMVLATILFFNIRKPDKNITNRQAWANSGLQSSNRLNAYFVFAYFELFKCVSYFEPYTQFLR
jgi:hypothetical protein